MRDEQLGQLRARFQELLQQEVNALLAAIDMTQRGAPAVEVNTAMRGVDMIREQRALVGEEIKRLEDEKRGAQGPR